MTYGNIYGFKYKNRLRFIIVYGHTLFDYPMAHFDYAHNRMQELFSSYSYDEVCNILDNPKDSPFILEETASNNCSWGYIASSNIEDNSIPNECVDGIHLDCDADIYREIKSLYNDSYPIKFQKIYLNEKLYLKPCCVANICKFKDVLFNVDDINYCDNASFQYLNPDDVTCENLLDDDKMNEWYREIKDFKISGGIMSAAIINLDNKMLEFHCTNDYFHYIENDWLRNKYSSFEKFRFLKF